MKFLLDVCVASRILHKTLTELGHDALSAGDGYASAPDEALPALAYKEGRVLVSTTASLHRADRSSGLPPA